MFLAGVRLDSGDLASLSKACREMLRAADAKFDTNLAASNIVASNDINEQILWKLNADGHEIDTYGIGTQLVTCYQQPALGCVYKLVEINGVPRIKLSQELEKVVIPGRKLVYRLLDDKDVPVLDLVQTMEEPAPQAGVAISCRHPFDATQTVVLTPAKVIQVLALRWDEGKLTDGALPALADSRAVCFAQLRQFSKEYTRHEKPLRYRVFVSESLFTFFHTLWEKEGRRPGHAAATAAATNK